VRALRESMHASIGSPGPMNAHGVTANAFESSLEMILDRVPMRLALPSAKSRPIVSDNQFQS